MSETHDPESTGAYDPFAHTTGEHTQPFIDEDVTVVVGSKPLPSRAVDRDVSLKVAREVPVEQALRVAQVLRGVLPRMASGLADTSAVEGDNAVFTDRQMVHELNLLTSQVPLAEIALPSDPNNPDEMKEARVEFVRQMFPRALDAGGAGTLLSRTEGDDERELQPDIFDIGHAVDLRGHPTARLGEAVVRTHMKHTGAIADGARWAVRQMKRLFTPRATRRSV